MTLEFSRNITFGQYIDTPSLLHRLDPRVKMVGYLALFLSLFFIKSFVAFALFFAGLVAIQFLSRISFAYVLRGMRFLWFTLLFLAAFRILFYASPTLENSVWWRWGILSISGEALAQSVLISIQVTFIYYLTNMLMFVTSLVDLTDGTESLLSPLQRIGVPINELVMVMVIAIKFVPILVAEVERLIKAQTARGVRFDEGGPIDRARKVGTVLIPLFVNAFARAEVVTTAMNARCYRGGKGRTKLRVRALSVPDILALVIAVVFAISCLIVARIAPL